MKYNRQFCISFAKFVQEENILPDDDYNQLFDEFEKKYSGEPEKPEPAIYNQVLEAAAEMCNVTRDELESGRKYGEIPSCKQMTCKILFELSNSDETIAHMLPMMGSVGSVRSRRAAASKYERTERSYRVVMNQLRERFGIRVTRGMTV